ncbi:MAG: crotonase/enoyl-CoA hydratase family protein [Sandaracinaceae bacterium]|nr:crotonase/enoyl-CoA hydratase family protein [Sandaracinaceae bacterium]
MRVEKNGVVTTWVLDRPRQKNAVDRATAEALADAVRAFEADEEARVAVLFGDHGVFCAGADLGALARGTPNRVALDGDAPMGPSRMVTQKPVIAAIEGHAVAGGLELALFCDLRVAAEDAVLGVFCRRWGVPLIDGGTVRLPRIVGLGRALDLILTGRAVTAAEAQAMGLVDRVVPTGTARQAAEELARTIASFPWTCVKNDRRSTYEGLDLDLASALQRETELGMETLASPELVEGVMRFVSGKGRGGSFE